MLYSLRNDNLDQTAKKPPRPTKEIGEFVGYLEWTVSKAKDVYILRATA
jgi:hypothetical protein